MIVNTVNHSAVPETGDVATGKSQWPCTKVALTGCEPKPHIVSPPLFGLNCWWPVRFKLMESLGWRPHPEIISKLFSLFLPPLTMRSPTRIT